MSTTHLYNMPTHLCTIREHLAAHFDDKYYLQQQSQNNTKSTVYPHISNTLY